MREKLLSQRYHIPLSMSRLPFLPFAALTSSFSESLHSFQSSCAHFFLFSSFPSVFLLSLMFWNSLRFLYLHQPCTRDFTCEANQSTTWKKKRLPLATAACSQISLDIDYSVIQFHFPSFSSY